MKFDHWFLYASVASLSLLKAQPLKLQILTRPRYFTFWYWSILLICFRCNMMLDVLLCLVPNGWTVVATSGWLQHTVSGNLDIQIRPIDFPVEDILSRGKCFRISRPFPIENWEDTVGIFNQWFFDTFAQCVTSWVPLWPKSWKIYYRNVWLSFATHVVCWYQYNWTLLD